MANWRVICVALTATLLQIEVWSADGAPAEEVPASAISPTAPHTGMSTIYLPLPHAQVARPGSGLLNWRSRKSIAMPMRTCNPQCLV